MSTIGNISTDLLKSLLGDTSTNAGTSTASNTTDSTKTTKTKTVTSPNDVSSLSDLDSYVSTLKAGQSTLADYMGNDNDSTEGEGLYSVLTYNMNGQVQNIMQQISDQKAAKAESKSTDSTNNSQTSVTKTSTK
jgi:hypothetical protein